MAQALVQHHLEGVVIGVHRILPGAETAKQAVRITCARAVGIQLHGIEIPVDVLGPNELVTERSYPRSLEDEVAGKLVFQAELRTVNVRIAEVVGQDNPRQVSGVGVPGVPALDVAREGVKGGTCWTGAHV
jgi:hypothetical protein